MIGESDVYDAVCERLDATTDGERASAVELALEGLYLARRIAKDSADGETVYGMSPASGGAPGRTVALRRYAGGPDPLAPPVDLREALDAIGEDVMAGSSPERAMRELLRQGTAYRVGLDELARQVAQRRREPLQKHQLGGTLDEIRQLLDDAVLAERKQLARDLDDDARFAEMRMEGLPASPAAAVTELADYEWRSSDAREKYEQIKDLLGRRSRRGNDRLGAS